MRRLTVKICVCFPNRRQKLCCISLSTAAAVRLQVNQLFEQFGGKAKLDELKDKAGKVRSPDVQPLESNLLSIRAALHWFLADGTHRRLVTSWRLLSPDLSQRPAKIMAPDSVFLAIRQWIRAIRTPTTREVT